MESDRQTVIRGVFLWVGRLLYYPYPVVFGLSLICLSFKRVGASGV